MNFDKVFTQVLAGETRRMTAEDAAKILGTILGEVQYTGQQPRDLYRQLAKSIAKNPALATFFANSKVTLGDKLLAKVVESWRKNNSFTSVHNLPVEIDHELQALMKGERAMGSINGALDLLPPGWKEMSSDAKETRFGNHKLGALVTVRHGSAYQHSPVVLECSNGFKGWFKFTPDAMKEAAKQAKASVVTAGHPTDREWQEGKLIATNPLLGTEYHDVKGIAWGWNGRSYINQGPTDKFIEQIKAGKYRLKLSASVVTAKPGISKAAGTFDFEGKDVGVQIHCQPPHLDVYVYYPLANIGKRGTDVDVVRYAFWNPNRGTDCNVMLRRALRSKPEASADEILRIIRSTLLSGEKESIERGDRYPAKMYEAVRYQEKGSSTKLPDPSGANHPQDRAGPDITVKFKKPNIWIYSKVDNGGGRVETYLTVSWSYVKKMNRLADELVKLQGILAVKKFLEDQGVRVRCHKHVDEMYQE